MLKINKIYSEKIKKPIPDHFMKKLKKEGIMEVIEWTSNLKHWISDVMEKLSGKEIIIKWSPNTELAVVPFTIRSDQKTGIQQTTLII
jgi:hypothetical protein